MASLKPQIVAVLSAILLLGSVVAPVAGRSVHGRSRYRCEARSEAKASLQAPPPGITVVAEDYGYHVVSTNISGLPPFLTGGDPIVDRGTIFLPEHGVDPEAYAPYAIGSAGRGRYSVVLNEANVKLVAQAIFHKLDIVDWAVVAHGEDAGALGAELVGSLPAQFTALALLGSTLPDDVDLVNSTGGVYVYLGSQDTVVPPSSLAKFASRVPGDAYIASFLNTTHYGFGYSDCLGNTPTPTRQVPGGDNFTATVAALSVADQIFDDSLNAVLRFQAWPPITPRALSFGNQALLLPNNLGSKPYPAGIPRNQVTFQRYPAPDVAPAPPRSWYVFSPGKIKDGVGLFYFPGAGISIKNYFPLAFEIAARGYLVVLLEQPSRSTTQAVDLTQIVSDGNNVISSPIFKGLGVEKWAVGAHSRGGAAATNFVALQNGTDNHKVQALVLHAGTVAVNLTSSRVPAVLIFGTLDAFFLGQGPEVPPLLNNATTEVHVVEGANHEQTADYEGSIVGTISSQEQQATFAQFTADFLSKHLS